MSHQKPRRKKILFKAMTVLLSLLASLLLAEALFRVYECLSGRVVTRYAKFENAWPSQFDPGIGFTFKPGSRVKWSNHLDFAVAQRANSLGFLDYEHTFEKPEDLFRILLLGDSFVEAAQVEIKDKSHILLEKKLNCGNSGKRYEVIALGYSGCGTSNELSFYEQIGRNFGPDLVILLFVENDFSNNSPILESVRNGWHPYHPPLLYYEKNPVDTYVRIDIDPRWERYLLKSEQKESSLDKACRILDPTLGWSSVYAWMIKRIEVNYGINARVYDDLLSSRIEELREIPDCKSQIEDWRYSPEIGLDGAYAAKDEQSMPALFKNAVDITEKVLTILQHETFSNGSRLLIVTYMTDPGPREKIMAIAGAHKIPAMDLWEAISTQCDPKEATFPHDGHWNIKGHKLSAELIHEYLMNNRKTLLEPCNSANN